jgi:hypothetical protein
MNEQKLIAEYIYDIARLKFRIFKLQKRLGELQWIGKKYCSQTGLATPCCTECLRGPNVGHKHDCSIANAMDVKISNKKSMAYFESQEDTLGKDAVVRITPTDQDAIEIPRRKCWVFKDKEWQEAKLLLVASGSEGVNAPFLVMFDTCVGWYSQCVIEVRL